jgi:MFS family permease
MNHPEKQFTPLATIPNGGNKESMATEVPLSGESQDDGTPPKSIHGTEEAAAAAAAAAPAWVMDTSDFPKPKALASIMVALFLAMFIVNLDATIIATAIPYITDDFNRIDEVAWYVAAAFLTFASFQSTWGKAFKYFPLKATFMVSLFIFEVGSIICALAQNGTTLIVGRALAGLGGAGVSSGVFILIAFSAPPRHVPAYMGIAGATYAIAALVGPLLGGLLTEKTTWRWCFWINLPIGAVTAVLILFMFKTPAAAQPQQASWKEKLLQMDLAGTFLIMAAVVCFILAFQWGGSTKSWSDSTVIGTLVGSVIIGIVFCVNEWYMNDRALMQPHLMRNRRIWSNCGHVFFVSGGFFALIYYLPIYFQSVRGTTPLESGVRNLPIIIGCVFSVLSGFVVSAFGTLWAPLMAIGAAMGTIGTGLIYTFNLSTPSREWIGYQALAGIGTGMTIQMPMMANQAIVAPMDIPSVSAITLFFQIIGGSFCISAAQAAFTNTLLRKVLSTAPQVSSSALIEMGATEIRTMFPADVVPAIVAGYMDALKVVFALATGLIGVSFLFTLVPRWEHLRPELGKLKEDQSSG